MIPYLISGKSIYLNISYMFSSNRLFYRQNRPSSFFLDDHIRYVYWSLNTIWVPLSQLKLGSHNSFALVGIGFLLLFMCNDTMCAICCRIEDYGYCLWNIGDDGIHCFGSIPYDCRRNCRES